MNYKIEGALKKTKKYTIIYAILWLFMVIVFIMPAGVAIKESTVNGKFAMGSFIEMFGKYAFKPFSSFGKAFNPSYIGDFWAVLWKFSFVYIIIAVIGTSIILLAIFNRIPYVNRVIGVK